MFDKLTSNLNFEDFQNAKNTSNAIQQFNAEFGNNETRARAKKKSLFSWTGSLWGRWQRASQTMHKVVWNLRLILALRRVILSSLRQHPITLWRNLMTSLSLSIFARLPGPCIFIFAHDLSFKCDCLLTKITYSGKTLTNDV